MPGKITTRSAAREQRILSSSPYENTRSKRATEWKTVPIEDYHLHIKETWGAYSFVDICGKDSDELRTFDSYEGEVCNGDTGRIINATTYVPYTVRHYIWGHKLPDPFVEICKAVPYCITGQRAPPYLAEVPPPPATYIPEQNIAGLATGAAFGTTMGAAVIGVAIGVAMHKIYQAYKHWKLSKEVMPTMEFHKTN